MNTCRGRFGRPPLILAPYPQPTTWYVRRRIQAKGGGYESIVSCGRRLSPKIFMSKAHHRE